MELSVLIQICLEKQRLKLVEEEQEKAIKQRIQNRYGTPSYIQNFGNLKKPP